MSDTEMVCEIDAELHSFQEDDGLDTSGAALATLKVAVARLANQDIREMKSFQLVEVIKASGAFSSRDWFHQLEFMEHDELVRLAYLARRTCRHQINTAYKHRGWRVPFLSEL